MHRAITIEEICKKLKPVLGKKADQLYLKYVLAESREDKEQIQHLLNMLYEKYLNTSLLNEKILLEPPQADVVGGEYPLGKIVYADKEVGTFGLREKDWPRHVCISGMSGSGKTTFAFQILANLIMHKKPFMIFDWKKSFRPLIKLDKEIMCFTVGNDQVANFFRININRPPKGVGPKQWVSILCDLIVESFFASFGVHKILREVLDQAYRDFGVYNGSNNYPTWRQIKDRLETKAEDLHNKRGRESEWMESALRIADSLTFGPFGDALNSKDQYGFEISEMLDKKVLFELHALGTAEKKFFCEFILAYLYFLKKFNQEVYSSNFKHAILVDEAHHIFLKEKPNFVKETVTEVVYRELREYGIGLVCLDQHISKLSEVVAGNSATTVAFQQVLPQDVETVSGIMQMRDTRKYFSMLPVGHAIVRLAERHYAPFLVKVPFIDIKGNMVTDQDIQKNMEILIGHQKQKKLFSEQVTEKNIRKIMGKLDQAFKISGVRTSGDGSDLRDSEEKVRESMATTIPLEDEHIRFLKALRLKPLQTAQTYNKIKVSARRGEQLKKDLIANSLVVLEERKVRGVTSKYLMLTERGQKMLEAEQTN